MLSWHERVHGHDDMFHGRSDHEHCGKIHLE